MEEWIRVDIDFSNCKRWQDLHEELKQKLEFPDFYGKTKVSAICGDGTPVNAMVYITNPKIQLAAYPPRG